MTTIPFDIHRAVRSIWESRLGLDVRRARAVDGPDLPGRTLIAVVRMDGAPRSAVILECPAPLARRAAGLLRGVSPERIEIEEVEDALGELAVMTGASLMPGLRASRPMAGIVDESEDRPKTSARAKLRREAFACGEHVFFVTVAG